jgi:hypothetical protein
MALPDLLTLFKNAPNSLGEFTGTKSPPPLADGVASVML